MDIKSVPPRVLVLTAIASYGGQILAGIAGWPLWGLVLATILPWGLVIGLELRWTYRNFHWLALFYLLVVTQGGHFLEHLVQMVQIHGLGLAGKDAHGVFGRLDIEWVHLGFNTWVLVVVAVLLTRYRDNMWLWVTFAIAGWHEIEHLYMIVQYVQTGVPGHPGLLSRGGVIGGGLPLVRPDLHFLYNVAETAPLILAFGYTLKHSYNEWLRRAFPHAPAELLTTTTDAAETVAYRPGETIIRQGDPADAFYILTRGSVQVLRDDGDGEKAVARLSAGQSFGEIGLLAGAPRTATVRADEAVEALRLDRQAFRTVVETSSATLDDLEALAASRRAAPSTPPDEVAVSPT